MFSALLYLQWTSLKNRLIGRAKRLKQPKYLIGAVVGGLYFYFFVFRWLFRARAQRPDGSMELFTAPDALLKESIGALVLLVIVLLSWIIPHKRAALTFTEAEIAFLFPAPVTRRTLIHFKLIRSQLGILFTILFLSLVFNRSGGHFWIRLAGWWVILSTLRLHSLGASFALTKLMDRGISTWKRRFMILGFVGGAVVAVIIWARPALPALAPSDVEGMEAFLNYASTVLTSGSMPYLLYPFRLVVRPNLATDAISFLFALWPALLLLLTHYWWVIRSDVAFEEASLEASQKLAERMEAAKSGKWQPDGNRKVLKPPFVLHSTGSQSVALFWKNLIGAGQFFSARSAIFVILFVSIMSFSLGASRSSWTTVVGIAAITFCFWTLLAGPQVLRHDLRNDLKNADLLKMYPMHGWQVILGEIMAPAVILAIIQWVLLILAASFLRLNVPMEGYMRFSILIGGALLLPLMDVILLLIPNTAVLIFPAWFQGRDGQHGIEAMGQRIVFGIAQMLAFVITLAPAAIAFAPFYFTSRLLLGNAVGIVMGSIAAAFVLVVEAALGIMILGKRFERFDLTAEQT
jgi:ABC-2 type transport system permease protein